MKTFRIYCFIVASLIPVLSRAQYRYSYLGLGKKEFLNKDYLEAINYFTYYINDHPTMYEAYYLRGLAKYNLDDLLGAEYDFTKAIRCIPEFPRLYMLRGVVRSENFKLQKASEDFNTTVGLDSTYTDAYYYRAINFLRMHDNQSALADANKIIALDSLYPNIYLLRGAIRADLEKYYDGISDFNKCITRNSNNATAYVERGSAYAQLNIVELAMMDFDTALVIDSLNPYAYFQRALVKMKTFDYESALIDLNRVTEISPENELAYFNRALIKSNIKQEGQAIQDFIHILNSNPDNMLVYYNMGISFARIGHFNEAIKCFNTAIKLYPDYADAYYQRGLAKRELGEMENAYADMQLSEQLREKNKMKDDTTKYKEGLEILKLTHFSDDFIREDEKKNKLQYKETKISILPIFQTVLDSSFLLSPFSLTDTQFVNARVETIQFSSEKMPKDSAVIEKQIHVLDSLILQDEYNFSHYFKRGLLHTYVNQPEKAIGDLSIALYYNPNNAYIHFNRANARITLLFNMISEYSSEKSIAVNDNIEIARIFSDIVYDLHKVLEINRKFIYARYNLGFARFLMEDLQGALAEFSAVTKERKIPEAHFNKALLQILLNQKEEGCIELGIAGEMGLEEAYSVIRKLCN